MALFSFIIISLINSILSKSQENEFNSLINYNNESSKFNLSECLNNSEGGEKEKNKNFFICILKEIRYNPDEAFNNPILGGLILLEVSLMEDLNENVSFIIKDLFEKNNTILNDLYELIKKNDSDSKNVLDYFIEILSGNNLTNKYIFERLKKIMNFPGFSDLLNKIYEKYKKFFFNVIDLFPRYNEGKKTVVQILFDMRDFVSKYQDSLFYLICNITAHYNEAEKIIIDIRDFVIYNNNKTNTTFLDDLHKIIMNKTLVNDLVDIILIDRKESNTILKIILSDEKLMNLTISFLKKKNFVEELADILMNLTNNTYINNNVPKFVKKIIGNDLAIKKIILDSYQNIVRNIATEGSLKDFFSKSLSNILKGLIFDSHKNLTISQSCTELFTYTYFDPQKNDKFRFYYTKKVLIDTTKSRSDFLTYENCLNGYENSTESQKYSIKPIYVIGKIIDKFNQSKLKNSTYYERYNYLIGFCFPQGKNSSNQTFCSNNDYGSLIKIFISLNLNVIDAEIKVFNITAEDLKGKPRHFIYFALIVIISAIPLFIMIFLKIYEKVKISNFQKNEINNKLKSQNQNKINEKPNAIQKRDYLYGKMPPKWFIYLNEYFNLVKNGSELFNFTLNQTKYNNFNGITYIKGILGISMILNIFGLTLLIISNLLTKIIRNYQLYDSLNDALYAIAFIGLRYSPRIIFSCSGYTLIYKFLNFIERESNFCFFKFFILQSYKFILLILASIYLRFCIYYIDVPFLNIKNPTSEIFNEELILHNKGYFFNLISFLFYNIKDQKEIFAKESAFIPYLYLPINEIILFIIGIALISIGYKFKLRFDIIIIISFLLIYLFKLIIFFAHFYKKEIYSTLYFCLYGYGILMLNPIFNFPSFLVGMYFGLVNYTIQKGINNLTKDERNNNEYELLEKEQISPLTENIEDEPNKSNLCINTISDDKRISRTLTFSRTSSSVSIENNIYVKDENNKSFDEEYEKTKKYLDINMPIENDDKLMEMPFLKSTVYFTNFHRKNQDKKLFKIIIAIFVILILFFIYVRYIFIYTYITKELKNYNGKEKAADDSGKKVNNLTNILSLEKVITNHFLNILYAIDIELVVIMINWIFFYLYFKGGQINDFLSHIYWSFFIKSYFSYILVSSLVLLYILYQSETIIKMKIFTVIFYSFISSFFIFIAIIIFYSCYEYPLKKIFKTLKIRKFYINLDDDELYLGKNGDEYLK